MSEKEKPRIAIVGAGPSGLIAARILEVHDIAVTVFEGEVSRHARDQGGTLDLHEDSGQKAMREAGLFSEFKAAARYDGEELHMLDKAGGVIFEKSETSNSANRPEIDRTLLRNILVDSVQPERIKWGHRVTAVEPQPDGRFRIQFQKASEGDDGVGFFDLVIGADGAWSRVRPLLSTVKPEYSGVTIIESNIADVDGRYPEIGKWAGRGSVFAFADKRGFQCQRIGDGSLRVYCSFDKPEDWSRTCGILWDDSEKTREALLDLFAGWAEVFKDIIRKSDDGFIPRVLYALPVGHKWESRKGLTVIGDAAHLMSPFAGVGVNVALTDGMDLALALVNGMDDWPSAIKAFEKVMFERGAKFAFKSSQQQKSFFSDDPVAAVKKMVESFMKQQQEQKRV